MFLVRLKQILITFIVIIDIALVFLLAVPGGFPKNHYTSTSSSNVPLSESQILKAILHCRDRTLEFEILQHAGYWTVQNLIIGSSSRNVGCAETITFTTFGDYSILESLPMIVKRWLAPISLTLFTPGYDLKQTLESIHYLRNCLPESELIRKYVSLHIFFPNNHMPAYVPRTEIEALSWNFSCQVEAPYLNVNRSSMYKTVANLTYPINVARNIARKAANTYFILPCDIELIPSPQLPKKFLKMILRNKSLQRGNHGRRVFAIPAFEVDRNSIIPSKKNDLISMLVNDAARLLNSELCPNCDLMPHQEQWLREVKTDVFNIFAVGKFEGEFAYWEPFFISDNREPIFDERVTWEGQSNRRIQSFAMCLLDYEYLILHPAFLIRMPGISPFAKNAPLLKFVTEEIESEYRLLYGNKSTCVI